MRERERPAGAEDPGVPEALPRTLRLVGERLGLGRVDRMWVFPPMKRGRRERGVVAVSLKLDADARRRILTVAYSAERTGRDLTVEHSFHEEGDAPAELLPRVMEGVVRRAGESHGEPREVVIDGEVEHFEALLAEFDAELPAPGRP